MDDVILTNRQETITRFAKEISSFIIIIIIIDVRQGLLDTIMSEKAFCTVEGFLKSTKKKSSKLKVIVMSHYR